MTHAVSIALVSMGRPTIERPTCPRPSLSVPRGSLPNRLPPSRTTRAPARTRLASAADTTPTGLSGRHQTVHAWPTWPDGQSPRRPAHRTTAGQQRRYVCVGRAGHRTGNSEYLEEPGEHEEPGEDLPASPPSCLSPVLHRDRTNGTLIALLLSWLLRPPSALAPAE